jgi:hypothetical protein
MRTSMKAWILLAAAAAVFAPLAAFAQYGETEPAAKPKAAVSKAGAPAAAAAPTDVTKTLKAAADALGMLRSINRVDAITRMEYWASGTAMLAGQPANVDYHVTLAYSPPGMRVEMSRPSGGTAQLHVIHVVNDKYAWDETEPGAGLAGSKGTATPASDSFGERSLQLWTFPYGVIKAALAAGEQAKLSKENGATVITFPMSGKLSGITVSATLNAKNLVTKVETHGDITTEYEYSDYGDHGDDPSDVQFPGHIVEKQGGKTVLDLRVKMDDPNNPYAIFPTPGSIMKATN